MSEVVNPRKMYIFVIFSPLSQIFWINLLHTIRTEKTIISKFPTISPKRAHELQPEPSAQAQTCSLSGERCTVRIIYLFRPNSEASVRKRVWGGRYSPTTSDSV